MANPKYDNLTEVGVGTQAEHQAKPQPLLDRASELEYVTLFNPLPFTFKGKIGQSRPVNAPIRIVNNKESNGGVEATEEMLNQAGLPLRNSDHIGQAQVTIPIIIEAGKTLNLRGDQAQVIVRQLTNEIMHYRGQSLFLGAPAYRLEVEREIVKGRHTIETLLNDYTPLDDRINQALAAKNEADEKPFPEVTNTPAKKPKDTTKS